MQSRMQALIMKVTVHAIKQCTSTSTGATLSRRETSCVRNTVMTYFEARCGGTTLLARPQ
jgi:hypothetical protein